MDGQDKDRNTNKQSTSFQPNLAERPIKDDTKAKNVTQVQKGINPSVQTPKPNLLLCAMQHRSQTAIKATEWRKRLLETQYASSKVKTRSKSLSPKHPSYPALHGSSALRRHSISSAVTSKTFLSDSSMQTQTIMSNNSENVRSDETNQVNAPLTLQFQTICRKSIIPHTMEDYQQSEGEEGRQNILPRGSTFNVGTSPPSPEQEEQEQTFLAGSYSDLASAAVSWLKGKEIRNFLRNDSEEEEEIIHTIPKETNKRAQEQRQQGEEERLHLSKAQEEDQHLSQQHQEEKHKEESLVKEHQEEEERLRREHREEKLRREQCEDDEKLRREQQREEEERLHRQYQEETLRREQQEIRLRCEQLEQKLQIEQPGEKLWWEQETEKHNRDQQKYYREQHVDHLCNDAMQSHLEPELFSVRHIKENSDEGEDTSQTLPVLPLGWGCPLLVPPPSPSRPKSPWGKLDPYDSTEEDREYVGFATLPNQVHRKYVKKGFEFTLMVAGESGLGKSTLINSLFLTDLYRGRQLPIPEERVTQTIEIVKQTVDIQEKGVRLRLTIVDTPGYGDAINNEECWKPVADYIDQQFEQYFRDESGLNRKNLQDTRVHCCLYFLSPLGHGMRPLDVEFLRALQDRVNIVPILGKADSLTPNELILKKQRIREELDLYGIQIYQFPECDSDQDEDFKIQDMELKRSIPFAVIGSNTIVETNGKRVRGRLYPWGVVEVENEQHCDFVKLRTMLIRTHMQDLKDVTRETHYENYRAQCIQSLTQRVVRERNRNKLTRESGTDFPIPSVPPSPDHDTMRLIREKDEELRRMQEVLQKMQRQMKDSN